LIAGLIGEIAKGGFLLHEAIQGVGGLFGVVAFIWVYVKSRPPHNEQRSNPTVETDARDRGARGSP
jgi:hypothetical protein